MTVCGCHLLLSSGGADRSRRSHLAARPDAELPRVVDFLRQRGLTLGETALVARFARAVDEACRNEAPFVHAEESGGVDSAGDGSAEEEKDTALQAARQRALTSFSVVEG